MDENKENENKNNIVEFPNKKEVEDQQTSRIFTKEEMIQQIKDCGESIIEHAESILGDEKFFLNLTVMFEIKRDKSQLPSIMVQRQFLPENQIDRITNKEK